jgi:cellobiose-specific phosphotransferase system component IIC
MNTHRKSSPLRPAAMLTLLSTPLLVLGALLSKMDTLERYYAQLWVVLAIASLCVVASVGSLLQRRWAAWTLTALYAAAAAFWLYSAATLAQVSTPEMSAFSLAAFPAAIGILCASFTVALFAHCSDRSAHWHASQHNDA